MLPSKTILSPTKAAAKVDPDFDHLLTKAARGLVLLDFAGKLSEEDWQAFYKYHDALAAKARQITHEPPAQQAA